MIEIKIDGKTLYTYTIKPFQLNNFLGEPITTLKEYNIHNHSGDTYLLYKTSDGNWYDIDTTIDADKTKVLRFLKSAIDNNEKPD